MERRTALKLLAALAGGCGSGAFEGDVGAAPDGGHPDTGFDAGFDAGFDGGVDAEVDARDGGHLPDAGLDAPTLETPPAMLTAVAGTPPAWSNAIWRGRVDARVFEMFVDGESVGEPRPIEASEVGRAISIGERAEADGERSVQARSDALVAEANTGHWSEAVAAGVWTQIPGMSPSTVSRTQPLLGGSFNRAIGAWIGYAWDEANQTIQNICAGGHGDLANNQQEYVDLRQNSPTWQEGWGGTKTSGPPSQPEYQIAPYTDDPQQGDVITGSYYYLPDENGVYARAATHTYHQIAFIPANRCMFIADNAGMNWNALKPAPGGEGRVWADDVVPDGDRRRFMLFDVDAQQWRPLSEALPPWPGDVDRIYSGSAVCVHPETSDIYFQTQTSFALWKLTWATQSWSSINISRPCRYGGMDIDPTRNKLLIAGSHPSANFAPAMIDLDTFAEEPIAFRGANDAAIRTYQPSVVYCSGADKWAYVSSTPGDEPVHAYVIDPNNGYEIAPLGANLPRQGTGVSIHNRVKWASSYGCLVYQAAYEVDAYAIRIT